MAPKLKQKLKGNFLVLAGIIGGLSLYLLSTVHQTALIILALFGFGIAFIFLQSTLISTAQEKLPTMRGTAMSLASFNMFVGGAVGTNINGRIMTQFGTAQIFFNTAFILFIVGIVASVLISESERQKAASMSSPS
jgi:predicted MFS family arabinose efflux permease